jgi:hypothetical protein
MTRQLRNPVFFVGSGRSGTTLLARLLARHPDIAVYPYEANDLWHPATYPWASSRLDVPPIWVDPETYTRISLEHRTASDDRRLKATFGAYQALRRASTFVNKSVLITFMMGYVVELFPDAKFIHLVRDGRAVALSFALKEKEKMARDRELYRARGYTLDTDELIDVFAVHWQQHIDEVERQNERLSLSAAGRILEVRYEALCAQPARELDAVARFVGVEEGRFSARTLDIRDRNFKFRSALAPARQRQLTALLGPALRRKGYSSTGDHAVVTPLDR